MRRPHAVLGILILLAFTWFGTALADTPTPPPPTPPGDRGKPAAIFAPTPSGGVAGPQIVGGQPADPGEYPWQAALVVSSYSNPYDGLYCGGSLLSADWAVTAAHCTVYLGAYYPASVFNIVLGVNNLSDGPTSGVQGQRRAIQLIETYPLFNENTLDGDVALLHLASPATLNSTVNTITPAGPGDAARFAAGVTSTVTGWGATGENDPISNALLEINVPIVSNATCNSASSYNGAVTNNMLCAGLAAGGQGPCYGDSGGPLIVPDGGGGWLLAGQTSWGYGCAEPNYYGVYTRIASFASWLDLYANGPPPGIYLPLITKGTGACVPDAPGESSNISNARKMCSGQTVTGSVRRNSPTDADDVYKIYVEHDQTLTVNMTGSGSGDADLYLYRPGSTDVNTDYWTLVSGTNSNNESFTVRIFATGYWYLDIYAYSGGTVNYSLTATVNWP
jgi:secreted trypsin-like serine protease